MYVTSLDLGSLSHAYMLNCVKILFYDLKVQAASEEKLAKFSSSED